MTAPQRGIWFAETLSPDYSVNVAQYFDIRHAPGGLDLDLLARCNEDVGKLLEAPYIRFDQTGAMPVQYVDVNFPQDVEILDFRDVAQPLTAALAWMDDEYQRPMDLRTDQLVLGCLLRVSDTRTLWYQRAHHIVCDGNAAINIARRIVDRYNTIKQGGEPDDTAAATLAEIVAYDQAYVDSARRVKDREYWASRIANMPEAASLARANGKSLPAESIVARRSLTSAFQERLGTVSAEVNSSQAALLAAAFAAFIARMCGTDDVVLSLPVTGRTTAKIRRSAGMLSNILPIRLREFTDGLVRDLAVSATVEFTGALRHQRYRTEDIRREAGLDLQKLYFGPAINMMFFDELAIEGAELDYRVLSTGIIEDLAINLYQPVPGASMSIDLQANPNLYSPSEIEEHLDRYIGFAERLFADLDQQVADVSLLFDGEDDELAGIEQGPDVAVASDGYLLAAFERQAAAAPDRPALIFGDRVVTYQEFSARVAELARRLIAAGVGPEVAVALTVPRSVEMMVAIYAILSAGGQYVPIDTDAPTDRAAYMLATAEARLLLVHAAAIDVDAVAAAESVSVPVWQIDAQADVDLATPPVSASERGELCSGAAAYTLFTSGSTGMPKGVVLAHDAVLNRLKWGIEELRTTRDSKVMQKTPYTFDCSVPELFAPLMVGGTLVVLEDGGHLEPQYVAEEIRRTGVTSVHFVPSMLAVFVELNDSAELASLDSLRVISTTGEALPPALAAEVRRIWPAVDFYNLYGPTEAAIEITYQRIGTVTEDATTVPIGVPVWNSTSIVLDGHLNRVPTGVPGELYLGGVQLARGYAARQNLTAERFVADPFGDGGARMYRTGDLVRRLADGGIEYLGRTDFQVKLRGQRIELGEIEAVVAGVPGVVHTVVTVAAGPGSAEHLVAYLGGAKGEPLDLDRVKAEAKRALPGYMVPAVWTVVDEFMLNSAGKIDRKSLPAPDFQALAQNYVAPESPVEIAIAGVLADVLSLDRMGATESFFDVGGDSLQAMRAVVRLSDTLGVPLTVQDLFSYPSVRELAQSTEGRAADSIPLAKAEPRPTRIPVSEAQRGMWLINRADPDSPVYNMPFAFQILGDLDVGALHRAVGDLLERQEALRTYYPMSDGDPVHVVSSTDEVLARLDMTPQPASGPPSEIVASIAAQGFDVTAEAPIRAALFRRGEADHVIVIVVHHVNADLVSMWPLAADFMAAYSARAQQQEPDWQPLGVSYIDFALWQQTRLELAHPAGGTERDRQLAYWRDRLAGAPTRLHLPADRPRPMMQSFDGGVVNFAISGEVIGGLEAIGRRHGATLFMVVHAAYAVLLSRLTGQNDVVVGIPYAGRSAKDLDDLVGMFANSVALRTELSPDEKFTELLARVRADDLDDMAHADVAFEAVVDAVGARRQGGANPIYQTVLSFQNMDLPEVNLHGVVVEPVDPELTVAKLDLQLTLYPGRASAADRIALDDVRAEFSYATALFDHHTVEVFAERLQQLLEAIVADPTAAIADLSIASSVDTTPDEESIDEQRTLPELVEIIGRVIPAAVAVEHNGSNVSFGDLAGTVTAMAVAIPDPDSALVTALMALIPDLSEAGPEALGDVLAGLRLRADADLQNVHGS